MGEITPLGQLGQAFAFSPEDLRDNRNHRLSQRQRLVLRRELFNTLMIVCAMFGAPLIASTVLIAWGRTSSLSDALTSTPALIGYFSGIALAGFFVAANLNKFALILDLTRGGRVETLTGQIQRQGAYLRLGKRQFLVEEATLDLVQSGVRYSLHFLPFSGRIVSIEFAE